MKTTTDRNCTCHTCNRTFHYLGITRHRAMHREKREDCEITFTHGDTYCYRYSQLGKRPNWQITRCAKILIITLALLLNGCVHVKLPDGTEYWRLGEQQIGEVLFTLPDGTEFLMVRQKSTIPVWIVTPAGWQLGEARKVKP